VIEIPIQINRTCLFWVESLIESIQNISYCDIESIIGDCKNGRLVLEAGIIMSQRFDSPTNPTIKKFISETEAERSKDYFTFQISNTYYGIHYFCWNNRFVDISNLLSWMGLTRVYFEEVIKKQEQLLKLEYSINGYHMLLRTEKLHSKTLEKLAEINVEVKEIIEEFEEVYDLSKSEEEKGFIEKILFGFIDSIRKGTYIKDLKNFQPSSTIIKILKDVYSMTKEINDYIIFKDILIDEIIKEEGLESTLSIEQREKLFKKYEKVMCRICDEAEREINSKEIMSRINSIIETYKTDITKMSLHAKFLKFYCTKLIEFNVIDKDKFVDLL